MAESLGHGGLPFRLAKVAGHPTNPIPQAIAGDDDAFFRGEVNLVLQALPTKIHLAPATIQFGNMVYSASANLSTRHLQYDIRE